MENENTLTIPMNETPEQSKASIAFITANTFQSSLHEIRTEHTIPVFVKDNEPVISQADFIETTQKLVRKIFKGEVINEPQVRISHPIKGRVPEAKDKPASKLKESEKTIFYERAAFVIEVPSIQENVAGNPLSLTVGGVKAYNLDNLYNRSGADQHFKVFIGFKNTVCTNLCISTDGYLADLKVRNQAELSIAIEAMIANYAATEHLCQLKHLQDTCLTEQQFALLIGRCRMYPYLSKAQKIYIGNIGLQLTDTQLGAVVKDYYGDANFGNQPGVPLPLWRLYNLLTGSNKTTYIDSFLDRSVNAFSFVRYLQEGLSKKTQNWYLK